MGDYISRQAALDAFGLSEKTRKYGGDHSGYDTMMLYEIQDVIEVLPSVTPKQRWIPTSERLPEPFGHVLRTVKSIGWNGTFSIYVDIGTICPIDTDVIAWMPLPEPYEPQVNEDEIVSLEFSEDIDTPGKFQTKDGVWHTATF